MLIGKEAFQPLDHQEQLLMRVISFQHQLALARDLALVGLDQRVRRVRQLWAFAAGLGTPFAARGWFASASAAQKINARASLGQG